MTTTIQLLIGTFGLTMFLSAIYVEGCTHEDDGSPEGTGELAGVGLLIVAADLLVAYGRYLA